MTNLLKADFTRILKSRTFHMCMIFWFCFAAFAVWSRWRDTYYYPDYLYGSPDGLLLGGPLYIGILLAVLFGSFIGTDYRNGTIRNKLIVGHSRIQIYLSNLIVCTTISLLLHVIWLAIIIGAGIPLIGKFVTPIDTVAVMILVSFFTILSYTGIFLLVCMIISSKAAGSVTVVILSFILVLAAPTIHSQLNEPEYFSAYDFSMTDEYGNTIEEHQDMMKNPYYLTGTKREIVELINDILPTCQIFQLSNSDSGSNLLGDEGELIDDTALFPVYSLCVAIITSAMGIIIFRRKNL